MTLTFLWHIHDYYKQDYDYVFEILKKQHYLMLIINTVKNKKEYFVGCFVYVIFPIEGSFVFFLYNGKLFRLKGIGILLLSLVQKLLDCI